MLALPIVCIACIIDQPGYQKRYRDRFQTQWLMCKTAFAILVERSAKFADARGCQLAIVFEQSGKAEDRAIKAYGRSLKSNGMPFPNSRPEYSELTAADLSRIVVGEPREGTKKTPMLQLADLVLFAMAKSAYQPDYAPFTKLRKAGKLIDNLLPEESWPTLGIKYSCFDNHKE